SLRPAALIGETAKVPTTRYSKYEATLEDLDMADLMRMLQDRPMQSGFDRDPFDPDPDYRPSMQDLYEAITEALLDNDLISDELLQKAIESEDWLDSELGRTVRRLAQRLGDEGYIRPDGSAPGEESEAGSGAAGGEAPERAGFTLTDKAIDFLGYRTLRDLLGAAGMSSVGSHDTRFSS